MRTRVRKPVSLLSIRSECVRCDAIVLRVHGRFHGHSISSV